MSKQLLDTPSKHPFSVAAIADNSWNTVREIVFRTGWGPMTRLAESVVVALMNRIQVGELRILTLSHIYHFRGPASDAASGAPLKAELRVINDVFWIFLANRETLANMDSRLSYFFTLPQKLTSWRFLNTIGNSQSNISAHYDISNEMFAGFLSQDMTYSCAIFEDLDGDLKRGVNPAQWSGGQGLMRISDDKMLQRNAVHQDVKEDEELHEAQLRKLRHILNKANILPGHRVLEIGSGWGSMAMLIAQTVENTTVDTITLSVQQMQLAQSRIADAGLEDRIHVHLMDYRNMPPDWQGAFDRVISIEMIEAVGFEYLEKYWEVIDFAMRRDGGVGVFQVITIPEPRFERYLREIDFIRKWVSRFEYLLYVFVDINLHLRTMERGASGRLIVDSVSNIGPHYARTLREWRRRFLDNFEEVVVPSLCKEYPDVMSGKNGRAEIEVFKRKWLYYYCYCEVGFTSRTLGDHIITVTREGSRDYGCNVYE
ncbi:hypothetical protein ONZ45_g8522 [Pleurotus djamor]|nr:hypothetical protein ONZ45_g8522 [Pleurotus djamor]